MGDPERLQTAIQMPRAKLPVALLEQADFQTQDKQDIKVRQGRNLRSQGVTGTPRRISVDNSTSPEATSVGDRDFRPVYDRAPFHDIDPVQAPSHNISSSRTVPHHSADRRSMVYLAHFTWYSLRFSQPSIFLQHSIASARSPIFSSARALWTCALGSNGLIFMA